MSNFAKKLFEKFQMVVILVPRVPRHECPFFGFHHVEGLLWGTQGNECALRGDQHACIMSTPDWKICSFNCSENQEQIKMITNGCRICPREFWPEGKKSWKGLPLKTWIDYVTSSALKRPE